MNKNQLRAGFKPVTSRNIILYYSDLHLKPNLLGDLQY